MSRRRRLWCGWALAAAAAAALGLAPDRLDAADAGSVRDVLGECAPGEGPDDALCGKIPVFEDRNGRSGRKIDLKVVVYPALSRTPQPDPLFVLVGGPGAGAADLSEVMVGAFREIRTERDLVFVDQRGTGESNGLECDFDALNLDSVLGDAAVIDRLRECMEGYDADLRLYTTPVAMDDLDEVRAALGYSSVNLWGGSYGTRAALVYLRRHGEHVRSAVLDGAVPLALKLPLSFPEDAQRAIDLTIDACEGSAACRESFPEVRRKLEAVLRRLARRPEPVRLKHPRTGRPLEFELRREVFTGALRAALYSSQDAALVPMLVEQAYDGDFAGVLAFGDAADTQLSLGMFFSVVCAEDAPWFESEERGAAPPEGFLDSSTAERWKEVCGFWPRGAVPDNYREPVRSDVPALVLSGQLDPVTPPRWGERVTEGLANALHVVVPGVAHGTSGSGCVPSLVADFVAQGSADGLDAECVANLRRAPFFVTPAGPRMEDGE